MALNCAGPLVRGFFSINTCVVLDLLLQRTDCIEVDGILYRGLSMSDLGICKGF